METKKISDKSNLILAKASEVAATSTKSLMLVERASVVAIALTAYAAFQNLVPDYLAFCQESLTVDQ